VPIAAVAGRAGETHELSEPCNMMILRSLPPSPFGRKVKVAVSLLGLSDQVKIEAADTNDPGDSLRMQNPLGKIPTLVLDDGTTLYDSRVIVEYLDHRAGGGKIIPSEPKARFAVLRLQALADGMTDAQILLVYEGRFRPPEHHVKKWTDYQADKIKRGLTALEADPPPLDAIPNVGQIALACFLGHRDLRFGGDWRAGHPKLVNWLDRFAARVPAFEATKVTA
jgi:glutathione S-transferase